MTLHHPDKIKTQRGATLLLALLILAAITSIVFSIAAIALNEIRTSNDLIKTEPVVTGAEATAEDFLFQTIRGLGSYSQNCAAPTTSTLNSNNVVVKSCATYYLSNPYSTNIAAGAEQDFYLYNPTNQSAAPGYTAVSIQFTGGVSGNVYLCSFGVANCINSPDIDSKAFTPSQNSWNSPGLNPNNEYQLIIVNGAGGVGSYTITTSPSTLGLPSGITTIQNSANNSGVTRKIQVTVPQ